MRSRNLIILALIVAAIAAYIFLYERNQLTTEELQERADKIFPDLALDELQTIEIRNTHGKFRIERSGEDWRLLEPIEFPADSPSVSSLVNSLTNLEVERSLTTDEVDLGSYGLDAPEMSVKLVNKDGGRFALEVGEKTALGSNRAVRRDTENTILFCAGWFTNDLDRELEAWRSKDVVEVFADGLASLQLVAGADRIHAVREGEGWRLLEPQDDIADRDHIRNLVSDLNGLRVEEFLDAAVDPAELALDPPQYQPTMVRTEGADPVRLDFGASREQNGATQVACRRDGRDSFWVSDGAAIRLSKAPVLWRSKKIYAFDSWDAESIVLTAGDQQITIERDEGLWKLPDGGEPDYTAIQERLSKLAALEAVEFDLVSPGTEEMGRVELGFEPDEEGGEPDIIRYSFHRPLTEGGQAMVVVSNRSTVMSVESTAVEEILSDLDALVNNPVFQQLTEIRIIHCGKEGFLHLFQYFNRDIPLKCNAVITSIWGPGLCFRDEVCYRSQCSHTCQFYGFIRKYRKVSQLPCLEIFNLFMEPSCANIHLFLENS